MNIFPLGYFPIGKKLFFKMSDNAIKRFFRKIRHIIVILISMAGYVPKNANITKSIVMAASLIFAVYLSIYQSDNFILAIIYFIISEILYFGFISTVLLKNGLRHWFIRKSGDEHKGYLNYEATLGFLFFHNGVSIGYISSSSPGSLFPFLNGNFLILIAVFMFVTGLGIKVSAANAVSVEIYYWKDMFLGRKVSDFVITGPYKYFSNPMYGVGQLPTYATALWYGSHFGLIASFLNQTLIFTFYYLVEKKFMKRIYASNETHS